uniref:SPNS lysolipid transporter 2, sphingosine-1-phosphate n=1 Tax=Nothobranchius furzeri TaxID=105023 RepID=A0A8C6Q6K4_NOTFU
MCVESDGCDIEGCSSSDEVRTLSGSMSPGLMPSPDLRPCKPGQKFRAALLRYRSMPAVAAGILTFGNVLNYMDRYTVAGVLLDIQRDYSVTDSQAGLLQTADGLVLWPSSSVSQAVVLRRIWIQESELIQQGFNRKIIYPSCHLYFGKCFELFKL